MTTNSADEARALAIWRAEAERSKLLIATTPGRSDWPATQAVLRAMLSHASAVGMPSREDVARVIDPHALDWRDHYRRGSIPWHGTQRLWLDALAKADAILALFPAQTDGGECDGAAQPVGEEA